MTKEQLIKEFRERFPPVRHPRLGIVDSDLPTARQTDIEAFLLSAFDAGRASGIEEGQKNVVKAMKILENCSKAELEALSASLTPSSSKDN